MVTNNKLGVVIGLFVLYSAVVQGNSLKNRFLTKKFPLCSLRAFDFLYGRDTSTFNLTNFSGIKVLDFDDNNTLNITSKGIKLIVKEDSVDSYTLLVSIKGKLILSKKHIKGISKVFFDKDYLLFSIFTYVDEDGNNEGNGYVLNLNNNSVKTFAKKLKNTCNPLIMNNYTYFIDGLSLIKTDLDFKSQSSFRITYLSKGKKKSFNYLDKYLICSLSKQDSVRLVIDFAPDKSLSKCRSYCGNIDASSKVILLKLADDHAGQRSKHAKQSTLTNGGAEDHVYKGDNGVINIDGPNDAYLIHEISHTALALKSGDLDDDKHWDSNGNLMVHYANQHGAKDEELAYRAQYAFDSTSLPRGGHAISSIDEIDVEYLIGITRDGTSGGEPVYKDLYNAVMEQRDKEDKANRIEQAKKKKP